MRILISILANNNSMETLVEVLESIRNEINNTFHSCEIFIATEPQESEVIKFCIEEGINYKMIDFKDSPFIRTTSFNINGYDEFQIYKITSLRNLCFDEAKSFDYILFVDSDNILPKDAINLLINSGKYDIAGWYFCKNVPFNTGWKNSPTQKEPFAVLATGCGCRLIRSNIFKEIKFIFQNLLSEEAQFSSDVRRLGYETYIHPCVYSDHIGGGYTDEARNYRESQSNK